MSAFVVKLPDIGEGIARAEIVAWHVAVGDRILEDDPIVEVMTDKATIQLPSPVSGTVTRLTGEVGDVVAVGSDLISIDVGGPVVDGHREPARTDVVVAGASRTTTSRTTPSPALVRPRRALAAPAVRERAQRLGVDLAEVTGTGPGGRVGHHDLDAHLSRSAPSPTSEADRTAPETGQVPERVKITGLRRNIAKRMQEAHRIPHFTYVEEVGVDELERLRGELNATRGDRPKLTMMPFLMRAVVLAVADFPQMNARFHDDDGVVERHRAVHIGIAVQTSNGLMVPVVKHVETRDLWDSAAEVARLAEAARSSTVTLAELTGSTITITSLGALGGLVSTPIINSPEVAVVGVNKIVARPVQVDGAWLARKTMNLSSSFDHRIVDGWEAAQFIQRIRGLLETPARLFLH